MITKDVAGTPMTLPILRRVAISHDLAYISYSPKGFNAHSLISHQTGMTILVLSDQMMEFIAVTKLCVSIQMAKPQAPMFQCWNMPLDMDKHTSTHARKLAIGTRGNVGSMLGFSSLSQMHRSYIFMPLYARMCSCYYGTPPI